MLHRSIPAASRGPAAPLRLLIENAALAEAAPARSISGVDVQVCSGPTSDQECCPLVTDGACPLGPFDVVVSALDGPWTDPVRRAWNEQGAVMRSSEAGTVTSAGDPFAEAVGTGLQALFRAHYVGPHDT